MLTIHTISHGAIAVPHAGDAADHVQRWLAHLEARRLTAATHALTPATAAAPAQTREGR